MTSKISFFSRILPFTSKPPAKKEADTTVTTVATSSFSGQKWTDPAEFTPEVSELPSRATSSTSDAIKRTLRNERLLEKISKALSEESSLDFIDVATLDPENLPVPTKELVEKAVSHFNVKAINFFFKIDSSQVKKIDGIIFDQWDSEKLGSELVDKYVQFILEIVLNNHPKLNVDFLHLYVYGVGPNRYVLCPEGIAFILETVAHACKLEWSYAFRGHVIGLKLKDPTKATCIPLTEKALTSTMKNRAFLQQVYVALENDESLDFIDEYTLDPENLPVPSLDLLKRAVAKANARVVKFFFEVDSRQTEELGVLIFDQVIRDFDEKKRKKYTKFVTKIIQENQPKLYPDFLHLYVLNRGHFFQSDSLCTFLQVIKKCFQLDEREILKKLTSKQIKLLAQNEGKIPISIELVKERL